MAILSSLIAGGATGLIGTILSNITDIFKQRQTMKHELKKQELDIQIMDKEYQFEMNKISAQNEAITDSKSFDLIDSSYRHDAASYSKGLKVKNGILQALLIIVDVIRGLVRPVLTGFLVWCMWDTRLEVMAVIETAGVDKMDINTALAIYNQLVCAIIYIGTTAVLWWFGTRNKQDKKV